MKTLNKRSRKTKPVTKQRPSVARPAAKGAAKRAATLVNLSLDWGQLDQKEVLRRLENAKIKIRRSVLDGRVIIKAGDLRSRPTVFRLHVKHMEDALKVLGVVQQRFPGELVRMAIVVEPPEFEPLVEIHARNLTREQFLEACVELGNGSSSVKG